MGRRRETTADQELRAWARKNLVQECVICGHEGDRDNPLQVDHIKSWSKFPDLRYSKSNVQMMCRFHNQSKGAKDDEELRRNWIDESWIPKYVLERF